MMLVGGGMDVTVNSNFFRWPTRLSSFFLVVGGEFFFLFGIFNWILTWLTWKQVVLVYAYSHTHCTRIYVAYVYTNELTRKEAHTHTDETVLDTLRSCYSSG